MLERLRQKIGFLLAEHFTLTLFLLVFIFGPIRGLVLLGVLWIIAE